MNIPKNKIKVVTPARYGSSRLPGKPLLLLNKMPVVWHVVQQALKANICIEDIIIATDDERIFNTAQQLDLPVIMTSIDHISGSDRINEVATLKNWSSDTMLVNVQGDDPLIPSELIENLISFSLTNPQFDITTAVSKIKPVKDFNNPNIVKAILDDNNSALYFTRSPAPYNRDDPSDLSNSLRHIGIYTYQKKHFKIYALSQKQN